MNLIHELAFKVFPYACLTVFTVGHAYRYVTDRYGWNARSSEFLEKKRLRIGSVIFHWGILGTLLGHAGGLLIPYLLWVSFASVLNYSVWQLNPQLLS